MSIHRHASLIAAAFALIGCAEGSGDAQRDESSTEQSAAFVEPALPEHELIPMTQPHAAWRDLPPVEYELLDVGSGDHYDVADQPIVLSDGWHVEIAVKPFWTYSAESHVGRQRLSLTHAAGLRVTTIPTGGVKLGSRAASAEIAVVSSDRNAREVLDSIVEGLGSTATSTESTVYRMLGGTVEGTRIQTAGPTVDVLVVAAGRHRQLRVIVTSSLEGTDLTDLRAAIETIRLSNRPPTPNFRVTASQASGEIVASTDATIGVPFTLGGKKMTIARRATVREQLRTMRFEHVPELTARFSTGKYPAVAMFYGSITIHAMVLPSKRTNAEIVVDLGIPIVGGRMISHTIDGVEYWGTEGTFSSAGVALQTQIFSFEREGRYFAVAISAPRSDLNRAAALGETVMRSLR